MTAPVPFRSIVGAGGLHLTGWMMTSHAEIAREVVAGGFDSLTFDLQHGLAGVENLSVAIAAAGVPALVRVPQGDTASISRVLDMGASAVIVPMVNSVAEARAAVAFAKYPPRGGRSWGPMRGIGAGAMAPRAYLSAANDLTALFVMIETRAALEACEDILAVDGVDGVLVGPSDLSISLTGGDTVDPDHALVSDALDRVLAAAAAHDRMTAIYANDAAAARAFAARGFRIVAIATDLGYVRAGASALVAATRAKG